MSEHKPWEYTTSLMPAPATQKEVKAHLDVYGRDGWELCGSDYGWFIYKRVASVAAHNARGQAEPIAWGWTPSDATWELDGSAGVKTGWQQEHNEKSARYEAARWKGVVVPLYAAPQPSLAKIIAEVEAMQDAHSVELNESRIGSDRHKQLYFQAETFAAILAKLKEKWG